MAVITIQKTPHINSPIRPGTLPAHPVGLLFRNTITMSFDITTIKPYLESTTVRGALTSVIGAVLGVALGGGSVALADDVYGIILGGTALAASGVSFYGSVVALIGRFKANSKIG